MTGILAAAILASMPHPTLNRIVETEWFQASPPQVRQISLRAALQQDEKTPPINTDQPAIKAPDNDPKHTKDLEDDVKLGAEIVKEVEKEMKASKSQPMINRVNRIGSELAKIACANSVTVQWGDKRLNPFPYKFTVLEGDDVNAFSLPGGYIYVYEGLLNYTETDDELAGVLGHEISHAAFRHVATLRREQSKLEAITLPLILISLLSGGSNGIGIAQGANLVSTAIGSGWSVKAEKAADFGGVQFLAKSDFNPVGMLTFIERLAYDDRNQGAEDWGIYKTHPPNKSRALAIESELKDLGVPIKRSEVSTTFRALMVEEMDGSRTIKLSGRKIVTFAGEDSAERANAAIERINTLADSLPAQYEMTLKGDDTVTARMADLFEVTSEDGKKFAMTRAEYAKESLKQLKAAMYELNFRVWNIP